MQQFNVHSGNNLNSFGLHGAGYGEFKNPASVCADGEAHIVVDFNNHRVQVLIRDGVPTIEFGDNGPEKLHYPIGCVYYKNVFVVADSGNGCLKVFDSSGTFLRMTGERSDVGRELENPWGLCVDKHGNILVSDPFSFHVTQFTIEGHWENL